MGNQIKTSRLAQLPAVIAKLKHRKGAKAGASLQATLHRQNTSISVIRKGKDSGLFPRVVRFTIPVAEVVFLFVDAWEVGGAGSMASGQLPILRRHPLVRGWARGFNIEFSFHAHETETQDNIIVLELRGNTFGASYCNSLLGRETSLVQVTPVPHNGREISVLKRISVQFNTDSMQEAAIQAKGRIVIADMVKKWYSVLCVGTVNVTLKERELQLLMGQFAHILNHFQKQFLTRWMALPLHEKMFPDERLSSVRKTHPLSCRASKTIHSGAHQFRVLSGVGKETLISDWEINVIMGVVQVHYLQEFNIPTILAGTKRKAAHFLLSHSVFPPTHITICRQAGKKDPRFRINLRGWGGQRSSGIASEMPRNLNKSFSSLLHAMTPVLTDWRVSFSAFSNITSSDLHDKLLQTEVAGVEEHVQITIAMFELVNKPFAGLVAPELLTHTELSCLDRYFDIFHLGEESSESHFPNH